MSNEIQNRYRVSSKFILPKIALYFGLFSIAYNLIKELRNSSFTSNSATLLVFSTIVLLGLLFFLHSRKRIDYNDIEQILYIVDTRAKTEIEVPVEKIDKILISTFGFGTGNNSYLIVYRDFHNQKQKVRLFPIQFNNSIETIKADAKRKNPNLITRNWTIGWNEFFD